MEEACSCAICHDLLIDCVETPCCTVGYCRECITKYLKTRSACPVCRKTVVTANLKPNKLAQRIVDATPMGACEYPGCKVKLCWGNVRVHEPVCSFKPVTCKWCPSCKITLGQQAEHELNDCPARPLSGPEEALRTECVAHPGEMLALFCTTDNKYLCVACWRQHEDSHTVMPCSLMRGIATLAAIKFELTPPPPALPALNLAPVALPALVTPRRRREFACSHEEVRTQANELARLADLFA